MTERERLIELLNEGKDIYPTRPVINGCRQDLSEFIADHLLSNGVIVPPVKLGSRQKIYVPIAGTTAAYETEVCGIGIDEDGDWVINPSEYPEGVFGISGYNLGKTVFLTKEEALKALKERGEGE